MSDTPKIVGAVLVALALFTGGIAISISVWSECRSGGNSVFYCMKLVSR